MSEAYNLSQEIELSKLERDRLLTMVLSICVIVILLIFSVEDFIKGLISTLILVALTGFFIDKYYNEKEQKLRLEINLITLPTA